MTIINSIITNILMALYQPFWFALVLSISLMFIWKNYCSVKSAVIQWISWFKTDSEFRRCFFLIFYTVMILFRTLINRSFSMNPLSNVIGIWGLYAEKNGEMVLTTEVSENLALFIPFTILLLWTYRVKILNNDKKDNSGISLPQRIMTIHEDRVPLQLHHRNAAVVLTPRNLAIIRFLLQYIRRFHRRFYLLDWL